MELCTTELRATFVARAAFRWPEHSGSLLRGMIGRALRQVGCARAPAPCEGACAAPATCTYARLFDPPPRDPPPHRLLAPAERPPPPFVLIAPAPGARALTPGAHVTIGVRLLGRRSAEEAGAVTAALEAMAALPVGTDGGAWDLGEIRQIGARNRPVSVEAADVHSGDARPSRLHVDFETPAWIETKGRVTPEIEASTLFRAVARRITTVCALYGGLTPDHDRSFAERNAAAARTRVTQRQLRLVTWERLSVEREARFAMHGLLGSLEIEGDMGPLLPWLRWGEIVHVGKCTSHGLGRMTVRAL